MLVFALLVLFDLLAYIEELALELCCLDVVGRQLIHLNKVLFRLLTVIEVIVLLLEKEEKMPL